MRPLLIFILIIVSSFSPDKPAYKIFDKSGKEKSFEIIVKECSAADVVLFGEIHNNPICHWLELNLGRDLYKEKKGDLILGAEMMEADDQIILDEYLNGWIDFNAVKREAKLWENYETDYRPLLDFAHDKKLNFIATNIPRRYAGLVARKNINALDSLGQDAKRWFLPLPVEIDLNLPGYKKLNESVNNPHSKEFSPPFMAQAQAIKDATMAYFILKNWRKGKLFFHLNGAYHSNNYEGIVWYLKKANPELKIVTISSVEQAQIDVLDREYKSLADFIICTPLDMTKTY